MKVLIVDDSPDALALAKARLGKEGHELLFADGGKAGLEKAAQEKPDLVLLDLDMPDMSGFEVCRALKADPDLSMIPVIFLSGSGTPQDRVKGLDIGAVDFVTKPFDTFELRARVNAALRTKRVQDLLMEYAHIDPLTGLANRRALMQRLEEEWAGIERRGGTLAIIMADIDHFKKVNDEHGHPVGDRALQRVADVIRDQSRINDLVSRYGGEEFAVVVPDEETDGAVKLAERCRSRIEEIRLSTGSETVTMTCSFGVAQYRKGDDAETLLSRADDALYRAKEAGRNRVVAADHAEQA